MTTPPPRPSTHGTQERVRLTRHLDDLIGAHRTVLITSPPGSGKHVALAHWARHTHRPVAWLHAAEHMAHQPTFLDSLVRSMRALYPALPPRARCLRCRVHSLAESIFELIGEPLRDDATPTALIMDSMHLLDDDALVDAVIALMRFAPPGLKLVLVYRGLLPLRLAHMRSTLGEVDPEQLRLTRAEITAVLAKHGVVLDDSSRAAALELTPWMSSANLLGMAVSLGAHLADLLRRGRREGANIDAWLLHQVLVRLPLSTRKLLRLLGVYSSTGQLEADPTSYDSDLQILAQLGLVSRRDDQHFSLTRFYRTCLQRLDERPDATEHRRAAAHLLRVGHTDSFGHAMIAQDPMLAGDTVALCGLPLSLAGQVDRIGAWLLLLPSEVRFHRIDVSLVSLFCTTLRGRTEELEQHMKLFRHARQKQPEQMHLGEQCVLQLLSGWHAQHQSRWGHALGHSYHTLRLATESEHLAGIHRAVLADVRMRAMRLKADALRELGCHDESIVVLQRLIRLAHATPHRALLARARVAMVIRAQGHLDKALHMATEVIHDADLAGLHQTHATGYARYVRSLVYFDRYQPYMMIEEAERAWIECHSAIHAHDRLCVQRTLQKMRRATDALQSPPPVQLFDVSTIAELPTDDLNLMNQYAYGLNHWEISNILDVPSADVRRRTLQICQQLGATSRSEAVQMLRAAGRVTHYPSLTMY